MNPLIILYCFKKNNIFVMTTKFSKKSESSHSGCGKKPQLNALEENQIKSNAHTDGDTGQSSTLAK